MIRRPILYRCSFVDMCYMCWCLPSICLFVPFRPKSPETKVIETSDLVVMLSHLHVTDAPILGQKGEISRSHRPTESFFFFRGKLVLTVAVSTTDHQASCLAAFLQAEDRLGERPQIVQRPQIQLHWIGSALLLTKSLQRRCWEWTAVLALWEASSVSETISKMCIIAYAWDLNSTLQYKVIHREDHDDRSGTQNIRHKILYDLFLRPIIYYHIVINFIKETSFYKLI